ncbi:MAG: hypothetical protein PHP43_06910, partial [Methanoculleus sp.]|nr:hypothetical protein [Methanoculleus sp.]
TLSGIAVLPDQVCRRRAFAQGAMGFPCPCQELGLAPSLYRLLDEEMADTMDMRMSVGRNVWWRRRAVLLHEGRCPGL